MLFAGVHAGAGLSVYYFLNVEATTFPLKFESWSERVPLMFVIAFVLVQF